MSGATATPTKADQRTWFAFRRKAGLPVPDDTPIADAAEKSAASESGSFFRGAARVLGTSRHVELEDGTSVSFAPPKVKTVRKVFSSFEAAKALEALGDGRKGAAQAAQIAVLVELLMLECVEFEDATKRPANMREWFDDRTLSEAASLSTAFASVIRMDELVALIRPLVGALR